MFSSTHYSGTAQNPRTRKLWSEKAARFIEAWCSNDEYPVLCYRGMSGVAAATALQSVLYDRGVSAGMFYVRKPDEESHGLSVERYVRYDKLTPCFIMVDDFVDSGDTYLAIIEKINKHYPVTETSSIFMLCYSGPRFVWDDIFLSRQSFNVHKPELPDFCYRNGCSFFKLWKNISEECENEAFIDRQKANG